MDDLQRSAKALIETHGKQAVRVAEKRAENAELSGSSSSAHIWRQVAAAIRTIQSG
jgi:hypothetical protein